MRSFDYNNLVDKAWDTDILSLVAKIHEYKGRQDLFIRQKPMELELIYALCGVSFQNPEFQAGKGHTHAFFLASALILTSVDRLIPVRAATWL